MQANEKSQEFKLPDSTEILQTALEQSAFDINCTAEDFLKNENVVVPFRLGKNARKYLKKPIIANLVSYGNNVVASVTSEVKTIISEYINKYEFFHLFETPNMNVLSEKLSAVGCKICFMAEFYLPDVKKINEIHCDYNLKILEQKDFKNLYLPEWHNALCKNRKKLDVLGVAAYDGEKQIALAGASADCKKMWQIGVDVLPEYRKKGIASAITSKLALEIFKRGKIPFYCSAWSNICSARTAIKSGFVPAWVEMTVKPSDFVDKMNV